MKLHVWHSPHDRCGVGQYGRLLDEALRRAGAEVHPHTYADLPEAERQSEGLVLAHFEPGLCHAHALSGALATVKGKGARVAFVCHWYEHAHLEQWISLGLVDRLILHRVYGPMHGQDRATVVPLGCPVYEPKPRAEVRGRLELPEDKTIVGTLGFLTWWKKPIELAAHLLDGIAPREDLFAYFHMPLPFDQAHVAPLEPAMRRLLSGHPAGARARLSTDFLDPARALDVARAMDIGILYHPQHTGSVSAATKQFVSARTPLVCSPSTHDSDLERGVVRAGDWHPASVCAIAIGLTQDAGARDRLAAEMQVEYDRLNMDATARRLCDVLRSM